jgi:hypothetical protein
MSRTQPLQNPDDHTHKDTIQIEMRPESIVIRTEVFEGVLSETRFDGVDCYTKLFNHLKSITSGGIIHAILQVES